MKKIVITFMALVCSIATFAQSTWHQGHINYSISVTGNEQAAQAMNGSTMSFSVKDSMVRNDMDLGMFQTIVIMDGAAHKGTLLISMMGNKYSIALSPDDIKQQKTQMPDYDVQYTDSIKTILGHVCKKAIVNIKAKKSDAKTFTVWYDPTIVIPGDNQNMYSKIKGLPLEYAMTQRGIDMHFTCTLIDDKPVDTSVFNIPDGYTAMSMDQFKQAMGGGAQH